MADIEHQYTKKDLSDMVIRLAAIRDFSELIDRSFDRDKEGHLLASIAFILQTLIEPIEDFLAWADIYATFPGDEEKKEGAK